MTRRCYSMAGSHQALDIPCDFCIWPAVFHWTRTYPDVLLCASCLKEYPEAQTAAATKCWCQHCMESQTSSR